MARRRYALLLTAALVGGVALALSWPAAAQSVGATTTSDPLVELAARLGMPGVLALLVLQLGRVLGQATERLGQWRPEVRITLSPEAVDALLRAHDLAHHWGDEARRPDALD